KPFREPRQGVNGLFNPRHEQTRNLLAQHPLLPGETLANRGCLNASAHPAQHRGGGHGIGQADPRLRLLPGLRLLRELLLESDHHLHGGLSGGLVPGTGGEPWRLPPLPRSPWLACPCHDPCPFQLRIGGGGPSSSASSRTSPWAFLAGERWGCPCSAAASCQVVPTMVFQTSGSQARPTRSTARMPRGCQRLSTAARARAQRAISGKLPGWEPLTSPKRAKAGSTSAPNSRRRASGGSVLTGTP